MNDTSADIFSNICKQDTREKRPTTREDKEEVKRAEEPPMDRQKGASALDSPSDSMDKAPGSWKYGQGSR